MGVAVAREGSECNTHNNRTAGRQCIVNGGNKYSKDNDANNNDN